MRGDLEQAEELYERALEFYQALEHHDGMASQYGNLGNVARFYGELDQAESLYRQALELYRGLGNQAGVASQYGNLANVDQMRWKMGSC